MVSANMVIFLIFLSFGYLQSAQATSIKLYRTSEFTEVPLRIITKDIVQCTDDQLPNPIPHQIHSIQTDTCIILHEAHDCMSFNSIKLAKGNHTNIRDLEHGTVFNSIAPCTDPERGNKLQLDLYRKTDYKEIAQSYNDICGCTNTTQDIAAVQILSLNNHGNCVKLFDHLGCTGKETIFLGGSNAKSQNMGWLGEFPVKSFIPCDSHIGCWEIVAKIYEITIKDPQSRSLQDVMAEASDFDLAAITTFDNEGNATVTQVYAATKKTIESVEITKKNMFSEMTRVETQSDFYYNATALPEFSVGPFSVSGYLGFRAKLQDAFSKEQNSSSENSEKYTSSTEKTFTVAQTIVVPPCTVYSVNAVVKYLQDYTLTYTIKARITGSENGISLPADVLKDRVQTMSVTGTENDTTLLAESSKPIKVTFGYATTITGRGRPAKCLPVDDFY